ncbi:hypothetical protein [Streptomyces sp. NPDC048338]|uniref:hypothetical protein n=1 Tax=Streptomyces sp. NPDC048338 TaxID=3365536 RepID=UPI0037146746
MRRTSPLGRTAAAGVLTAAALLLAVTGPAAADAVVPAAGPSVVSADAPPTPADSAAGPAGDDRQPGARLAERTPGRAPVAAHGSRGRMPGTGAGDPRLWLLGGLVLALAATGAVARAALRERGDH